MLRKVLFVIGLVVFSLGVSAQSFKGFFDPLPKASFNKQQYRAYIANKATLSADSTMTAFRPIVNVASYGLSGGTSIGLSGAGISYQHLVRNSAGVWSCTWSINALAWYSVPLTGDEQNAFAYGLAGGFFNNLLLVGAAYDGSRVFPTVGLGMNLNNGPGLSIFKK